MPNVDIDGTVAVEDAERYFLNLIDKTSTADVMEVKHGEWIKEDNGTQYWYQCSECSERPPYNRYKELWLSACCPNCGAKMDVSKMEITTEGGKAE